jgi:hypothetical protein
MARNLVNNEYNCRRFPFEFVSSEFGEALSGLLRRFEEGDVTESHAEFAAAINTILVWSGARTATLPCWEYFQMNDLTRLIDSLNKWSRRVPRSAGTIDEVAIIERPRIYRGGNVIPQEMIVRRNCRRVRVTREPPVGDEEIGFELDMYPANVKYFKSVDGPTEIGFSIWEAGSDVLLFAEVFSLEFLMKWQLVEFLELCEERVSAWNSAMEKLGLVYRFYGTMDWSPGTREGFEAENTLALFGRRFVGVGDR